MQDVTIIGAGVTGSAIARELSRLDLDVLVLEKESDVCEGTSKANSGIVHSGYDAKPGTLKAKFNVEGNKLIHELSKTLDFPFKENGSIVLELEEEGRAGIEALYERGKSNGVPGLRILEKDELLKMEPSVSSNAVCALYAPTGGIVCPFNMTIAFAENAADNGVTFKLDTEVKNIEKKTSEDGTNYYRLETSGGIIDTKVVINAAGVYSDVFHNMVSEYKLHITPRKGEYLLMDKMAGDLVKATLFQLPSKLGKGVLVTPTVHGNLMVGPTAEEVEDPEDTSTSAEGLASLFDKGAMSVEKLPRLTITSFAGLRAHEDGGDFVIGEVKDAPGFIDAAGIESPGLTAAPAVGAYVAGIVKDILGASEKKDFIDTRKGIPSMALASDEERAALIASDPAYAHVICRCELVTEGEIKNAINRTLGARTVDGIKRRTRAGMGRCQTGFCLARTIPLLAEALGVDEEEIVKSGNGAYYIEGKIKDSL
ncbi:MAG: NAD(P)/FAD-dependent oxidoreductase [Lachnospiraceae bacterium]|nr:NAD(P)/FAD-dependent oxidoreductase [Lachnospiraceae bacterium]